jgi:serine/threonine-protein kinase HipA
VAHEPLTVWLYDTAVGRLTAPRFGRIQFEPSAEAIARWGLGSTILSIGLALGTTRPTNDRSLRFFDGLLPEGMARTQLERRLEIRRGDTFGLLAALGRDSAGALVLVPETERPNVIGEAIPISDQDLAALIRGLEDRPLGADVTVRVSLTGQQDKLLLTRLDHGGWARPANGLASTHILKPEDSRFPNYAVNEALCMTLARLIGLTTVETSVLDIDGIATIVVERYDRRMFPDGSIQRIHQEDMCQALSIDNVLRDRKYEREGGPSLRDIATLLERHGGNRDRQRLLAAVTFNVAIGNSDAHGRNFSVIHEVDGSVRLAPLYDVSSTVQYPMVETPRGSIPVNHDSAMSINGKWNLHSMTIDDLAGEASRWGMIEKTARATAVETLDRLAAALDDLVRDHANTALLSDLVARCRRLRSTSV